jgi:hypothetical protein
MNRKEQEALAKSRFRPKAALMAGSVGALFFILFALATPWTSTGVPDLAMGRPVADPGVPGGFMLTSAVQLALGVLYAFVVSAVVFRFDPIPAVLTGALLAAALYGLNYLFFRFVLGHLPGDEGAVLLTHVVFCMLAAALYKAFSVAPADG